tara:strand:- start:62 stop:1159 length:1098 start_codon:yes stop_codon:yes gene_type:complete
MALHRNSDENNKHTPKGFTSAGNMFKILRDESGESRYTPETTLPSAKNFVDGSVLPPTQVNGDIYVIIDTGGGAISLNWSGASYGDWLRYNSSLLAWIKHTPNDGDICYNGNSQTYQKYNSPDWEELVVAENLANANLVLNTNRVHDLAGFGLTFSDGQTTLIGTGTTDATSQLLTENGAGLEGLRVLDNGDVHVGELFQGVGRGQILAFQPLSTGNFLEVYNPTSTSGTAPYLSMGLASNIPLILAKSSLAIGAGSIEIKIEDSAQRIRFSRGGVTFATFDNNGESSINNIYGFGFGTNNPHNSAKVEIKSTTGGLLIPRMTGAQASLITPVEGLQVHIKTSTDATFTAFGPWSYVNGVWTIMI